MDIIQLIGFLIAMGALFVIMISNWMKARRHRRHPEEYQREKEKREQELKQFLKALNMDMEDEEKPLPKPVKTKNNKPVTGLKKDARFHPKMDEFIQRSKIEDRHPKTAIEQRVYTTSIEEREFKSSIDNRYVMENAAPSYHVIRNTKVSRASRLLEEMPSKKRLIIYSEIMGKPKGLPN